MYVPSSGRLTKKDLIDKFNAPLQSIDYKPEYIFEDDQLEDNNSNNIDAFEVKVLNSFHYHSPHLQSINSNNENNEEDVNDNSKAMIPFLHIRSLTSTEENVVPKVFLFYQSSLGTSSGIFQAHSRYLKSIRDGTQFVFVTAIGSGRETSRIIIIIRWSIFNTYYWLFIKIIINRSGAKFCIL